MNRRFLILAGFGLLAGCASAPAVIQPAPPLAPAPPPSIQLGEPLGELEPLYSLVATSEALTIQVASHGCTRKEDFAFHLERRAGGATLAFGRRTLDRCRTFAMGKVQLSFTWAELGLEPRTAVFLLNPVTAWSGPGA